jgi:hypothetical protein
LHKLLLPWLASVKAIGEKTAEAHDGLLHPCILFLIGAPSNFRSSSIPYALSPSRASKFGHTVLYVLTVRYFAALQVVNHREPHAGILVGISIFVIGCALDLALFTWRKPLQSPKPSERPEEKQPSTFSPLFGTSFCKIRCFTRPSWARCSSAVPS